MLIEKFSDITGIDSNRLFDFSKTASHRYKEYTIKKRNGGFRTIHQPSKILKFIQRFIVKEYSKVFDPHESATAYVSGRNIRYNASQHKNTNFTLRVDFKDFFPSIRRKNLRRFLKSDAVSAKLEISNRDLDFVCNILLHNDRFTIGAPSSPFFSNLLMYDFDTRIYNYCVQKGQIYTRYSDDVFVSTLAPSMLDQTLIFIKDTAEKYPYAKLRINNHKTSFLSKRYSRQITGLVITPDGDISIGRNKKREIRSAIHRYRQDKLDTEEIMYLRGYLSYVHGVEPLFLKRLEAKYGQKTI